MYGSKYQFILITGGPVLKHLGYVLFGLSLCTEQASMTTLVPGKYSQHFTCSASCHDTAFFQVRLNSVFN